MHKQNIHTHTLRKARICTPVKSLNADGTLLFCVTQNTSAFFVMYNPGSIITGLALWNLPHNHNQTSQVSSKIKIKTSKSMNKKQSELKLTLSTQYC